MLAGGASRRLGGALKGLEVVGGARIIDRVASVLASVCADVVLAANAPEAPKWLPGKRVLADRYSGAGGLAGVDAALQLGSDVLVVAWDMPFVTTDLLLALLATAREGGVDVVLPDSDSPYGFEPFCAFYSTRVKAALQTFLENGAGAARDFLHGLPEQSVRRLSLRDSSKLGDPTRLFLSVNSPDDLERARAIADAQ